MKIVQVILDSFQEYEDYQALVLFCSGCNLACRGCYNYEEITQGESKGTAIELLDAHITPLHEAAVFLGGEPTLWGQKLVDAAERAHTKHALRVKVFTNGMMPDVVENVASRGILDALSVDLKCISNASNVLGTTIDDEMYLQRVTETVRAAQKYRVDVELRTTTFQHIGDVAAIERFAALHFPGVSHILQAEFTPVRS